MLETFDQRQQEAQGRAECHFRPQGTEKSDSKTPSSAIVALGWPPEEISLNRVESLEESPVWEVRQLLRRNEDGLGNGLFNPFPLAQSQLPSKSLETLRNGKCNMPETQCVPVGTTSQWNRREETMTDNGNDLTFQNEANIPGAAGVIRTHGGAAFYCTVHKREIQPLMYEVDGDEIPCCEECMLEEMVEEGREIKTPLSIDPVSAAVGDHDITEDIWECMT
jgi:hypothetical protein